MHCNCYAIRLLSITQPFLIIICSKSWRIKKTNHEVPQEDCLRLSSPLMICALIQGDKRKTWLSQNSSLSHWSWGRYACTGFMKLPADCCPCFNKLERWKRLGEKKLEANHFVIMVKDVGMQLIALIGSIMTTLKMKLYWSLQGNR